MEQKFIILIFLCLILINNVYGQTCSSYDVSESLPYWQQVNQCTSCSTNPKCGFCLSTLKCVEGDDVGPLDNTPCPDWRFENFECPVQPTCEKYSTCGTCAGQSDCAWCASAGKCMTVSDVFTQSCRGTVFDVPCPGKYSLYFGYQYNIIVNIFNIYLF